VIGVPVGPKGSWGCEVSSALLPLCWRGRQARCSGAVRRAWSCRQLEAKPLASL